jgi:hypothetical protein
VLQLAPPGLRPQDPFTQEFVPPHCPAVCVQDVKHLLPLQAYGKQVWLAGGMHWPAALQVDGGVYAPPAQDSEAQTVSGGYFRQAPAPSHFPSVAQEAAPLSWHWPCGSPAPFPTFVQCPSAICSAQLWQAPPQALSQQTPSTHCLDWHCAAAVQAEPSGFSPHDPPMQLFGETQSLSEAQLVLQLCVEQR